MFFRPIVWIEVPSLAEDMTKRNHNRFAKDALRDAMLQHFRRHIRKHFATRNRARYGHMPRAAKYQAYKRRRYGSAVDLVKTGASRDQIVRTVPQVRIGGAAAGGRKGLSGSYRLRFAWKGGAGRERPRRGGVTAAVMLAELARWADDEAREAQQRFHEGYWRRVTNWRGSRKRIRPPRR